MREFRSRISLRSSGLRFSQALSEAIHGGGELYVPFGDTPGVMGGQRHFDLVVDVEPFRMVVEFFGNERGTGHESKRLVEILEGEFFLDGIAAGHLAPALKFTERSLPRAARQFLSHDNLACTGSSSAEPAVSFTRGLAE